jgi:hypothetical protein
MRSAQLTYAPFLSELIRAIIIIAMNIVHTWHMRHRSARESNDIHGDHPRSRLLTAKGKGALLEVMRCFKQNALPFFGLCKWARLCLGVV